MSQHCVKWFCLALSAALVALTLAGCGAGLSHGGGWEARLLYPLSHVSIWHCAVNVWCLLCMVFYYDTEALELAAAYAVAVCIPGYCLNSAPTMGLSGALFALLGMSILKVARKWILLGWCAFYIALGFALPGVNALVHLHCFLAGLALSLVFTPTDIWNRYSRY